MNYKQFNWLFLQNQIFIFCGAIIGDSFEKMNDGILVIVALSITFLDFVYCILIEKKYRQDD